MLIAETNLTTGIILDQVSVHLSAKFNQENILKTIVPAEGV